MSAGARFALVAFALVAPVALAAMAGCKRVRPPAIERVWLGPTQGCGRLKGAGIACWGSGPAFGVAPSTPSAGRARRVDAGASPSDVAASSVVDVALGQDHACAVLADDTVRCWGSASEGQLGVRDERGDIRDLRAERIAVGAGLTCAVERAGAATLRCFGRNDENQLGGQPPVVLGRGPARALVAGAAHVCAAVERVTAAGGDGVNDGVVCFGRGFGASGRILLSGARVVGLSAGAEHTCAVLDDGSVRCWGKNAAGQLGDGTTADAAEPVQVANVAGVVGVAAGARHTCAALRSRTVACWGDNAHHQLADGTKEARSRAVPLHGLVGVEHVAAAGEATCARLGDGDVRCWGKNDTGQLGDGTAVEHDVPMPVKFRPGELR